MDRGLVSRDKYVCSGCRQAVMRCRRCRRDYARVHETHADDLCLLCSGTLPDWDDAEARTRLRPLAHCSACLRECEIVLVEPNLVRADVYECTACANTLCRCGGCSDAFARDVGVGPKRCAKCSGRIQNWDDYEENIETLFRRAWCSHCTENSQHMPLKKDSYICLSCTLDTTECSRCEDGMATKTVGNAIGARCLKCRVNGAKGAAKYKQGEGDDAAATPWERLLERKRLVDEQAEAHPIETARSNMARDSEFKAKAAKAGLLRPFLLLVSLPPAVRCKIALLLSQSTFVVDDTYGEAHVEANRILFGSGGIQSRTNNTTETLNPAVRSSNWYETLYRLADQNIARDELPKQLSRSAAEALCAQCGRTSTDPQETNLLRDLEVKLLEHAAKQQAEKFSSEAREWIDNAIEHQDRAEFAIVFRNMLQTGVWSRALETFVIETALFTIYSELGASTSFVEISPSKLDVAALQRLLSNSLVSGRGSFGTVKRVKRVALLAANIAFGVTFPILGIASTVAVGIALAFGSSIERLQVPVGIILAQELVLATAGVSVDQYA